MAHLNPFAVLLQNSNPTLTLSEPTGINYCRSNLRTKESETIRLAAEAGWYGTTESLFADPFSALSIFSCKKTKKIFWRLNKTIAQAA